MSDTPTIEERVSALESAVASLQKERPGRRIKPIVRKEDGICGVNPTCNSAECEDASIYRYQQGCRGTACKKKNREYYSEYRANKRQESAPSGEVTVDL